MLYYPSFVKVSKLFSNNNIINAIFTTKHKVNSDLNHLGLHFSIK